MRNPHLPRKRDRGNRVQPRPVPIPCGGFKPLGRHPSTRYPAFIAVSGIGKIASGVSGKR